MLPFTDLILRDSCGGFDSPVAVSLLVRRDAPKLAVVTVSGLSRVILGAKIIYSGLELPTTVSCDGVQHFGSCQRWER